MRNYIKIILINKSKYSNKHTPIVEALCIVFLEQMNFEVSSQILEGNRKITNDEFLNQCVDKDLLFFPFTKDFVSSRTNFFSSSRNIDTYLLFAKTMFNIDTAVLLTYRSTSTQKSTFNYLKCYKLNSSISEKC